MRRFQARHGLTTDGVVRATTLAAMNVPATTRRDQLKVNIGRLKTLTTNLGPRYVVVNIPAARVEAIENDVAVQRHTAVVGKPDRPSPDINSKIVQINFNPFWTVPVSIVRKDLIPLMQDKPDYLTQNHIRIYDPKHKEVEPAQINWYSEEAVHYTFREDPGDSQFARAHPHQLPEPIRRLHARYAAEEFVRRGFPLRFVRLLPGAKRARIGRLAARWHQGLDSPTASIRRSSRATRSMRTLTKPVPLHWVYVTAWSASDGIVQFREDIYGRDGLGGPADSAADARGFSVKFSQVFGCGGTAAAPDLHEIAGCSTRRKVQPFL